MARESAPLSPSRKQNVDFSPQDKSPVRTSLTPPSRKRIERENTLFSPETPTLTTPSPGTQAAQFHSVVKQYGRMIPIRSFDDEAQEVEVTVRGNLGWYKKSKPLQKGSDEWFAYHTSAEHKSTAADWFTTLILTLEQGGGILERDEARYDKKLSLKRDLKTLIHRFDACNEKALADKIRKFYTKNKDCSEEILFARAKIFALQLKHEEKIPDWKAALQFKKFHLLHPLFPLPQDEDELLSALLAYDAKLDAATQHMAKRFFGHFITVLDDERLALAATLLKLLSLREEQNLIAKTIATNERLIEKHQKTLDILSTAITEINEELALPSTALSPSASQETIRAAKEERLRKENKARFLDEEFMQIVTQIQLLKEGNGNHNKRFTHINDEIAEAGRTLKTSHENNWNRFEQVLSDWMEPKFIQELLMKNINTPGVHSCLQPAVANARATHPAFVDYLQATIDGIDQYPTEMEITRAYLEFYIPTQTERHWAHPAIFNALLAIQQTAVPKKQRVDIPPAHQLLKPPTFLQYFMTIKSEIEEGILSFREKMIKDTSIIQSFTSDKIRSLQQLMKEIPAEKIKVTHAIQAYMDFIEGLYEKSHSIEGSEELLQMYHHFLCGHTNNAASAKPTTVV